jgi:hypothetical protein
MSKLEGLELLYKICDFMGMDNLPMADLELVMATVRAMEKKKGR